MKHQTNGYWNRSVRHTVHSDCLSGSQAYYCPGEIRNQGTYGSYGGICSYGIGNYFCDKIYNVKL